MNFSRLNFNIAFSYLAYGERAKVERFRFYGARKLYWSSTGSQRRRLSILGNLLYKAYVKSASNGR